MKTTAKGGLSASIHALRELDRMADIAREALKLARAGARFNIPPVHRAQPPAQAWLHAATFFGSERIRVDGSRSSSGGQLLRNEKGRREAVASIRSQASALNRPTTMGADTSALIGRLVDSRNAARAISAGTGSALQAAFPKAEASRQAYETLELNRATLAGTKFKVEASSIRAVTPPPNLSPREFASPIRNVRDRSHGASNAGININSSPTVVINATAAGSNLQRDVLSALRTHREELFDQLKRESARRERAQF